VDKHYLSILLSETMHCRHEVMIMAASHSRVMAAKIGCKIAALRTAAPLHDVA
jgi:hypothetical protein